MLPDHLGVGAGADLFFDFHADGFEIEAHLLQHVDRDALAELDQAEQQMLGADVIVVEAVGFLAGQGQDLLGARGEIVHDFFFSLFGGRCRGTSAFVFGFRELLSAFAQTGRRAGRPVPRW